jgi:catechol 2,3-dioxygenase-like lactoylglutathione lyase family enzyme
MTVELDHTIVPAHDKQASAEFLATILGVPVGTAAGPFVPVTVGHGVTLDYDDRWEVASHHYAFFVDDETFDHALSHLEADGITIYADPGHRQPGEMNNRRGGRGLYFSDPNGHNMEIFTRR